MIYSKAGYKPNRYHIFLEGRMSSLCGKAPAIDDEMVDSIPEDGEICGKCKLCLDSRSGGQNG